MSLPRFFLTDELADDAAYVVLPLSAEDARHLAVVLRASSGDEIVAVTPAGSALRVRLDSAGTEAVRGTVLEVMPPVTEPRVTLVYGVSKGAKVDQVVEDAVEVGASAILPVFCARSVVRMDAQKRAERGARWRRVAAAAAKQAQRTSVPRVDDPCDLRDALAAIAEHDLVLVAWEEADGLGMREALDSALASSATVAVVVGPEGGLTDFEVESLREAGAIPVTLGATILRTETAGLIATALAIHELGGLGNTPGADDAR